MENPQEGPRGAITYKPVSLPPPVRIKTPDFSDRTRFVPKGTSFVLDEEPDVQDETFDFPPQKSSVRFWIVVILIGVAGLGLTFAIVAGVGTVYVDQQRTAERKSYETRTWTTSELVQEYERQLKLSDNGTPFHYAMFTVTGRVALVQPAAGAYITLVINQEGRWPADDSVRIDVRTDSVPQIGQSIQVIGWPDKEQSNNMLCLYGKRWKSN